jgi:hypothetical protein
LAQRPAAADPAPAPTSRPAKPAETPTPARKAEGLSFTEKKRLAELPDLIARLEAEIGKLAQLLETPDLFTKEPVKFRKASEMLADRQSALSAAEEEWLDLEPAPGADPGGNWPIRRSRSAKIRCNQRVAPLTTACGRLCCRCKALISSLVGHLRTASGPECAR